MDEVIYSKVTKTESRWGCGLGRGRVPAGGCVDIRPWDARDNQEFSGEKNKTRSFEFKKKCARKKNRDLSENLKKKVPAPQQFPQKKKPAAAHPAKKKELREQTRNFKFSLR
jgi:hypothetical protein